jgi:hypothetical protein
MIGRASAAREGTIGGGRMADLEDEHVSAVS